MNWELEFKRCLEKRWLVLMPEARHLVKKELTAAQDDLNEAEARISLNGARHFLARVEQLLANWETEYNRG